MVIITKGLRAAALAAFVSLPTVPAIASDVAIVTDIATVYDRSGDIATVYDASRDIGHLFEDTVRQGKQTATKINQGAVSQAGYGYNPCPCPCPPAPACPPMPMPSVTPAPSGAAPTPAPSPSDDMPPAPAPTAPAEPAPAQPPAPAPTADSFTPDDNFVPMGPFTGGAGAAASAPLAIAVSPGYIDPASVRTRLRVRYDDATGANAPTRAEFLYPTLGNFAGGEGPNGLGSGNDVDFREVSVYAEFAFRKRFSAFIETPVRWIDGVDAGAGDEDQQGAGDIRSGFRWGLVDEYDSQRTLQLRVWSPTGDSTRALGVGHASIDITYLFNEQLNDTVSLFGHFGDWQTLDAASVDVNGDGNFTDLDGNILMYGLGAGVTLIDLGDRRNPCQFTGLVEIVGWTVLDGFVTPLRNDGSDAIDASGDTIINGKYGVRWNGRNQTVYVGYGHNWSSDRWYSDLFRLEWGYNF